MSESKIAMIDSKAMLSYLAEEKQRIIDALRFWDDMSLLHQGKGDDAKSLECLNIKANLRDTIDAFATVEEFIRLSDENLEEACQDWLNEEAYRNGYAG